MSYVVYRSDVNSLLDKNKLPFDSSFTTLPLYNRNRNFKSAVRGKVGK